MSPQRRLRTQEATMSETLVYISSNGDRHDPEELHLARFANGLKLIEREGRSNPNYENLGRLQAVYDRRKAEWDAAHPQDGE